ncbi:plastocyanin/azurin family copper-binding protein [Halorussus limi]|uniref:Plastocyanin/azurin family copper-binding protein n=1 Tax=Halorussus limi TaxID=2938695 RepID=A0A8U0HSR7_9EURY|nr:plastocyanin/azurin family copper-binding protein [Halorussus limi]UPV73714.1 plastocyanin/azurin family copper-binding protein [Halorussus limi]
MTGDSTSAERGDSTGTGGGTGTESGRDRGADGDGATPESDGGTGSDGETRGDDGGTVDDGVTRRTFIRASGATAAAGAGAAFAADDVSAQTQTYRFGGEVAAWRGRAPAAIEGESNPTIELQAGQEYEFWFENIDGAPHNIAIYDDEENVIQQSDTILEEGATASITFTATSNMAQYVCTVHPTSMIGDLNVTGQVEGSGGEGGGIFSSLSFGALVLVAGLALAFLSPLLFALFLFSRGDDRGGETTTRP